MLDRAALCCATLLSTLSPAFGITDPVSGLDVTPPAPFTATLVAAPNAPATVMIASTTGVPEPVLDGPTICTVRLRLVANNATLTQAEINEIQIKPEIVNFTKASLALAFDLGDATPFTVAGVTGLEFEGQMKAGPKAGTPLYIASMQTSKGVTVLMCFTSPAHFPDAIPQFRAIRDTIRPPR